MIKQSDNTEDITKLSYTKYMEYFLYQIRSDQSLSRVRLCDPMNRSMPDFLKCIQYTFEKIDSLILSDLRQN